MSEALQQGTVVRLHSLQKLSLNGALAMVVSKQSEDRWVVHPNASPEPVAVRSANLHRARELPEQLRQAVFAAVALSVLFLGSCHGTLFG